jgi:regulation of enolase protein 1 (concanavalin A-like superfamily)
MVWDGVDRRSRVRDEHDLDFTWQDAFYSMRRDIASHLEKEDTNAADIATIKADLKSIFDPDY